MVPQHTAEKFCGRGCPVGKPIKSRPTKADYASIVRENEVLKAQVEKYAKEKRKKHSFVGLSRGCGSLSDITCGEEEMGVVIPEDEPAIAIKDGDEYLVDSDKPQKRKTGLGSKMSHHVMNQGKIGRRHLRFASENTGKVLDMIPSPKTNFPDKVMKKLVQMNLDYLFGNAFRSDLITLCDMAKPLLESEPRCIRLQSPCHVFGDIHGNMDELHFFNEVIWAKGVHLTPGKFIFLGDYVDRGIYGLECVAYLLAMKVRSPTKVYLLRGNHELRDVNSWNDFYGEKCLISQCLRRFGPDRGMEIWEAVNQVFDRLPLAAIIDEDIFCIHGGIPRPVDGMNQVDLIMQVPPVAAITPPYPYEHPVLTLVAHQCLWSDPVKTDDEIYMDGAGFGSNPRGNKAQCYGRAAVDSFLSNNDFSYIIRAHEKTKDGMSLAKDARVITVFSTSKDHNLGQQALAACLLIDDCHIEVITKDPSYERMARIFTESCGSGSFQLVERFGTRDIRTSEIDPPGFNEEELRHFENNRKHSIGLQQQSNLATMDSHLETPIENGGCNNSVEHLNGSNRENNLDNVVPDDSVNTRCNLPAVVEESFLFSDVLIDDSVPYCMEMNDRRESLDPNDFEEMRKKSRPVILRSTPITEGAATINDKGRFNRNGEITDRSSSATFQDCSGQKKATTTSKPKPRETGNRFINAVSNWAKLK